MLIKNWTNFFKALFYFVGETGDRGDRGFPGEKGDEGNYNSLLIYSFTF